MTEYAIVNLDTQQVVPQRGQTALMFDSLNRVRYPDANRSNADSARPGHEIPPQYDGEDNPLVQFRLYEVAIVDVGSGPVVASTSDPVFDAGSDTVTMTRTLEAAPEPSVTEKRWREYPTQRDMLLALIKATTAPAASRLAQVKADIAATDAKYPDP